MSAALINTKVTEAVTAQESGDWDTALSKLRSAAILLAGKPDTDFDGEKLLWDREAIMNMIEELKRQKSTARGIVQIPVVRHLITRSRCGECE